MLGVPTCVPLRPVGTPKAPSHAEDLTWGLRYFPMVAYKAGRGPRGTGVTTGPKISPRLPRAAIPAPKLEE